MVNNLDAVFNKALNAETSAENSAEDSFVCMYDDCSAELLRQKPTADGGAQLTIRLGPDDRMIVATREEIAYMLETAYDWDGPSEDELSADDGEE